MAGTEEVAWTGRVASSFATVLAENVDGVGGGGAYTAGGAGAVVVKEATVVGVGK